MGLTIKEFCTIAFYPADSMPKQVHGVLDAFAIKKSRNEAVMMIALAILEGIGLRTFSKESRAYKYIQAFLPLTCLFVVLAVKSLYEAVRAFERGMKSTNSSSLPSLELLSANKDQFVDLCQRLIEREKLPLIQRSELSAEDSALLQDLKQQVATMINQPVAEIEKLSLQRLLFLVAGNLGDE